MGRVKRGGPTYEKSRAIDRTSGTVAQQRPFFTASCARARRGGGAKARSVLTPLSRWGGSYNRTAARRDGRPGRRRLGGVQGPGRGHRAVPLSARGRRPAGAAQTGQSHQFDITLGEAYALRTLGRRALRLAAERTSDALARRFGTSDPARWREPRRMYDVTAQGAARDARAALLRQGDLAAVAGARPLSSVGEWPGSRASRRRSRRATSPPRPTTRPACWTTSRSSAPS